MIPLNSRRGELERRTETLLDWPVLLARLAEHAVTPIAKERCVALEGTADPATVSGRYEELQEWTTLRDRAGDLAFAGGADPRAALRAAVPGGLLDAEQCREIAVVLGQVRDVRRALVPSPDLARLAARAQALDEVPEVRRELDEAIDAQGRLRESATPELRRLRREVDRLRQTLIDRVGELLSSPRYEPWLQDTFVTQRQDRYVLPIKIEHRAKVAGIIHELSASGATVFIEPEELVEANNDLKWAEMAVAQEIERIFRRLTDLIAAQRNALETNVEILTALDVIQAKGRLGLAYHGMIPTISRTREIAWRGLRHPLLALRGIAVVPNDVTLEPDARALVISGPNTGGKTVLLKAMGLAALMTRAGIPLPCDPDSVSPVFPAVLMDAGDDQDLARDLSTFAAHVRVVCALIDTAPPGSLILLDELATATDPEEGAALAQALVEAFMARNVLTVVTTHYTALKAWAAQEAGARDRVSAGMGYDVETMTPTYRLALGRPGASLGIDVAARLGLPTSILARARGLVSPQAAALGDAIAALERERRVATDLRQRLTALEAAARDAALRQDAAAAQLEREREAFAATKRERLAAEVRRAKTEMDAILEQARREPDARKIRVLIPKIAATAESRHETPSEPESVPPRDFDAGARVRVASLRADGVLVDATSGRKRVRVLVGDREVSVSPGDLRPAKPAEPSGISGTVGRPVAPEPAPDTVNVIGQRVDAALERVDRALDKAAAAGATRLRVLHGHGNGRLKRAIREHLAGSPYVASHRPGDDTEGGDAATVITLTTG
ncbi:MAG TPA: Smr/MutS family protein [Nitrospiria bacterium]|nr:Smr/MutS family protein [Nitrospiria bacterium]